MIQLTDDVGHPSNILEANTLLDPPLLRVWPHDGAYQLLHQAASHTPHHPAHCGLAWPVHISNGMVKTACGIVPATIIFHFTSPW